MDPAFRAQIVQVLANANSTSNQVQYEVTQALIQLGANPAFPAVLTQIFAQGTDQPEVIRQVAGLLLKKTVDQQFASLAASMPAIKEALLHAVLDPNETIRKTAGSLITTVMARGGTWIEALHKLTEALCHADSNVVDGALSALDKICEDTLGQYPSGQDPFIQFSAQHLVPKLFLMCDLKIPVQYRRTGMKVLNHFALHYMLEAEPLSQYLPQYKDALGVLAVQDPDQEVLRHVCQGLVHLVERCPELLAPDAQGVLQMLLQACKHPSYDVRYVSLDVWHHALVPPFRDATRCLLPALVPILLQNMVYTKYDYETMDAAMIEEDNAAVPDSAEDLKPRFHEGRNDVDDDDDEGGSGSAWGTDWTVRKAAAASLDGLAQAFHAEVLPHLLPHIESNLKDGKWEVQESGVLALGAVAHGCIHALAPHLPGVIGLLLQMCAAEKPLLRSISCWCVSRFGSWICHDDNAPHLAPAFAAVLTRVVDRNKRVQEAACSAFATMEEEARHKLVPFLPEIVGKLAEAFKFYQAKNLLILYDATGTLASAVGHELDRPEYAGVLLPLLFARMQAATDQDRSLVALFECLTQLAHNVPTSFQPYAATTMERCMRIIKNALDQYTQYKQVPEHIDPPDREIFASSIDAISGMVSGLGDKVTQVMSQDNYLALLPYCCNVQMIEVKQATFALLGDTAKSLPQALTPALLQQLMPCCIEHLKHGAPAVSNNASWAIGEICVKVGTETMQPFAQAIAENLVATITSTDGQRTRVIVQNACITLGRLALVSAALLAPALGSFCEQWCMVIMGARNDADRKSVV